ncbi:MAG: pyroglutamyl-peptidase I [Oscillospiraceae bacterium]|nr:pyroglutamyl-peptidase I [Oscillospiraceae bacterium]
MAKKLLITGFDPFGGESINPSWEAVKMLPDVIGGYELTKMQIPTVFGKAAETVMNTAEKLCPNVIICVGQAGGRSAVTPEVIGINLRDARIPDNEGNKPVNVPVIPDGDAAYFSTIPVRKMTDEINAVGIPAALSYSAGAFVCNDVLYTLLHKYSKTDTLVGFIHVPFLPEQAKNNEFSLPLMQIRDALCAAVKALD